MTQERNKRFHWTEAQEEEIRRLYPTLGPTVLARKMSVTVDAIQGKARYMGVRVERVFTWTTEAEQTVRERYKADGPAKLAKELGTTANAITAKARRLKVESTRKRPPKGFEWTDEMIAAVKERYVAEGPNLLASEFGTTVDTVRRKAVDFGLHTNAGHVRWGQERAESNDSCNIHYFDSWSPNMAYILGFLFADGCMDKVSRSISVNICRRDEAVLHFIKRELEAKTNVRYSKGYPTSTGSISKPQAGIVVSSKVLCERLETLGLHPRKTYRDDPFPEVPDDMLPHFIRGYLDGDGTTCIGRNGHITIGFVGSVRMIIGIRDKLVKNAGMQNKPILVRHGKGADYANVCWGSIADVKKFNAFAYPKDFGFCLDRKKANIDKWLSEPHVDCTHYSEDEDNAIRDYYRLLGSKGLSRKLDRTEQSIRYRAWKLGIKFKERITQAEREVVNGLPKTLGIGNVE